MLTCCCRVAIIVRSCSSLVWQGANTEGVFPCCCQDILYGGGSGDGDGDGDDLYSNDS